MKLFILSQPPFYEPLIEAIKEISNTKIVGICSQNDKVGLLKTAKTGISQLLYDLNLRYPKYHIFHHRNHCPIPNLNFYALEDYKAPEFRSILQALRPDLLICFGFPKKVSQEILNIPTHGAINIHPGKLPERGGGTPLRWSIYYGDKTTALTAHDMISEFDAGKIILEKNIIIEENDTYQALENKILSMLPEFISDLFTIIQNEARTYNQRSALKPNIIKPFHGAKQFINWENQNTKDICNISKAMHPRSGALTFWKTKQVCFSDTKQCVGSKIQSNSLPGTILDITNKGSLIVKTLDGALCIESFLHGHRRRSTESMNKILKFKLGERFVSAQEG